MASAPLPAIYGRKFDPFISRSQQEDVLDNFFRDSLMKNPNHPCLELDGLVLSYAELDERSNQMAHLLRSKGIGPTNPFVVLLLDKNSDVSNKKDVIFAYISILGILKAGGAYVPVDPAMPADRITSILSDCSPNVLITCQGSLSKVLPADFSSNRATSPLFMKHPNEEKPEQLEILVVDTKEWTNALNDQSTNEFPQEHNATNLCYAIYTSGSTGKPKACLLQHGAVSTFVRAAHRGYSVGYNNERFYQCSSLCFDVSVEDLFNAWGMSNTLVVPTFEQLKGIDSLPDTLTELKISYMSTVPTLATMLCDSTHPLPYLRTLGMNGEALPLPLLKRLASTFPNCRFINGYGPTEISCGCSSWDCDPNAEKITVGRPYANYLCYVINHEKVENGIFELVPFGTPGELLIAGRSVALGYLRRDDLTKSKFVANPFLTIENFKLSQRAEKGDAFSLEMTPEALQAYQENYTRAYRSGDLVTMNEEGYIEFFGRIDQQIKLRGYRIELGEVEEQIMAAATEMAAPDACFLRNAVVKVAKLQEGGEDALAAYLVPVSEKIVLDIPAIVAFLKTKIPSYMVPAHFQIEMGPLPVLPSGKLDRKNLPPLRITAPPVADDESDDEAGAEPEEDKSKTALLAVTKAIEKEVGEVWKQIFNMKKVPKANKNFFMDLGGHSLIAARSIAALRKKHDDFKSVSVLDLYQNPTLAGLSAALAAKLPPNSTLGKTGAAAIPKPSGGSGGYGSVEGTRGDVEMGGKSGDPSIPLIASTLALTQKWSFFTNVFVPVFFFVISLFVRGGHVLASVLVLISADPVVDGKTLGISLGLTILAHFAVVPVLFIAVWLLKWTIVGRFEPGTYPLYQLTYWRFWLWRQIFKTLPLSRLSGTRFLNWYMRCLGANVAPSAWLYGDSMLIPEILSIGEGSTVNPDSTTAGYIVEHGFLRIGTISIGKKCFIGVRGMLCINSKMEDGSQLHDLSTLAESQVIPAGQYWRGTPARPHSSPSAVVRPPTYSTLSIFCPTQLTAGYEDVDSVIPPVSKFKLYLCEFLQVSLFFAISSVTYTANALVAFSLIYLPNLMPTPSRWWAIVFSPLKLLFTFGFMMTTIIVKKLLIPSLPKEGFTVALSSFAFVRLWSVERLLQEVIDQCRPVYGTIYAKFWGRMLGMKLGDMVEVSTPRFYVPDLVHMDDQSFLPDAVALGTPIVYGGTSQYGPVYIGKRSFCGNVSAVRPGTKIGENCLAAVMTAVPDELASNKDVVGSPPFPLPRRAPSKFSDEETFAAPLRAKLVRGFIELWQITLPVAFTSLMYTYSLELMVKIDDAADLSLASGIILFPLFNILWTAVTFYAFFFAYKWLVIGKFRPSESPLFAARTRLFDFLYAMCVDLFGNCFCLFIGTPIYPMLLRWLGCNIGRNVYLENVWIQEFDCISIGDNVCMNDMANLQGHLYEDRVLKIGTIKVDSNVNVGAFSVVLYDTHVEENCTIYPESFVMKGEILPANTNWFGNPVQVFSTPGLFKTLPEIQVAALKTSFRKTIFSRFSHHD